MLGFETCWSYLIYALNFITLSPIQHLRQDGVLQVPLTGSPVVPQAPQGPIFEPPNAPEHKQFMCEYPDLPDYEFCSASDARDCWLKPKDPNSGLPTYDIHTNYEDLFPKGITRKYVLDITNETIYPDGCINTEAKLFNATYPGPWIEACWGDDIEVTVRNHLPCNGTSIHMHGLRQFSSNEYDGVNAVTQCSIAPGDSYTYKFHARQYGSTWYHSHYSLQYGDGLAGPLTIHGPSSGNYTTAKDPILMTDWNQRSAFQDWAFCLHPDANGNFCRPNMTSILLNGIGIAPKVDTCDDRQPPQRYSLHFQKGVRYLLRLINTSVDTTFVFSIDGHRLEVIQTDLVPIKPYTTESVLIGIGQRYHVIVEASPHETTEDGNYWIRTVPADGCESFVIPYTIETSTTGIVRYDAASKADPTSAPLTFPIACSDEPYDLLQPVLEWNVPNITITEETDVNLVLANTTPYYPTGDPGFRRWMMYKAPLWLNFSDPTILNPQGSTNTFEAQLHINTTGDEEQWVELLITGPPEGTRIAAHPIHLHGHDFALLAQGNTSFDPATAVIKRNNPPRRDVALLPQNGYLLIAFKVDNPGVWLMHCHIAWHASSGLAMQILENMDQLVFNDKEAILRTCENWDRWFGGERVTNPVCDFDAPFQDDSGI